MVLVVVMALMYEPVGFMLTCLLFLFAYGLLLGQRNIPMLILSSVIITIILYIGFAVFLSVLLPRGQILPYATSPCSLSRSSRVSNRR